jgi:hypothetical protein
MEKFGHQTRLCTLFLREWPNLSTFSTVFSNFYPVFESKRKNLFLVQSSFYTTDVSSFNCLNENRKIHLNGVINKYI